MRRRPRSIVKANICISSRRPTSGSETEQQQMTSMGHPVTSSIVRGPVLKKDEASPTAPEATKATAARPKTAVRLGEKEEEGARRSSHRLRRNRSASRSLRSRSRELGSCSTSLRGGALFPRRGADRDSRRRLCRPPRRRRNACRRLALRLEKTQKRKKIRTTRSQTH